MSSGEWWSFCLGLNVLDAVQAFSWENWIVHETHKIGQHGHVSWQYASIIEEITLFVMDKWLVEWMGRRKEGITAIPIGADGGLRFN